jgi:N-acetylglucosamine kinase-like BadF-type ATPase
VIEHDLLAAARAGLGRNAGMVAILGTGSHVATFNGTVIDQEAISLGYMLGDEGGGVDIGRRLLKAYFYNELPTEEMLYLEHALSLTKDEAIEHLYRRPWPNRWMASLAPLVAQRPFLREAIAQPALEDFAKTHLFPLAARTGQTAFSAIGSVSAYFEAELRAVTVQRLHLTAAMANPLQALVHYHQAHGTEA